MYFLKQEKEEKKVEKQQNSWFQKDDNNYQVFILRVWILQNTTLVEVYYNSKPNVIISFTKETSFILCKEKYAKHLSILKIVKNTSKVVKFNRKLAEALTTE